MIHCPKIDAASADKLPPWEYIQRAMSMAGLGFWRIQRPPDQPGARKLITNESFINLAGYASGDFPTDYDAYLEQCVHPHDRPDLIKFIEDKFSNREGSFQTKFRQRHGRTNQWRRVEIHGEVTGYTDDGRPLDVFGCLIDIQETTAQKELEEERGWYKAVLDNLPFPTSVFDRDRRWTYLNPSAARTMGGQVADYLGRSYAEGWHDFQDSREIDDDDDFRIRTFTRELKNPRRILSGRSAFMEDSQGQGIGFIETFLDVTQAHEAEERTRLMLDATPLACGFFSREGSLVDCNLAAAALCGFATKKGFLDNFYKLIPPTLSDGQDAAKVFKDALAKAFQEGRSFLPEMVLGSADGSEITGEVYFQRVEWREDYTVLVYIRDLRTLRMTQKKLEQESLLLKNILDGCPVPFAIFANGVVQFSTPFAKTELGLEVGTSLAGLTIDSKEMIALECELAANRAVNWRPLKLRKPDSSICENLLNAYPADFEGRQAIMTWLMDVTQLRRNERELSVALYQAESSTRAKNDFMANISHEIRTPMNAIIGFNKLLQETELDSQQMEFVEKTRSSAKSLLHLLNDILDFSHLDSGKLELTNRDFHLQNVIKNAVDLVADRIKAKGLEFMVLVAPNTPVALVGDEYRLLQTLNNILSNAVKFTDHGEISLTVETMAETETEATVLFMIRDTGIGIDRQRLKSIFAPFVQADTSFTRQYGGSGLGLAISKKLVHMMGGEIWGESEPGQGSAFGFTAHFGRHNRTERFIESRQDFIGLSALIVDDNEMSRIILNKYLQAFGFEVLSASSGEEALDLLRRLKATGRHLDLVVMDLLMAGWDGLETTRRINEAIPPGETRPQIIMATAYSKDETAKAAAEVGINTILEKPISADSLESILDVFFKAGAAGRQDEASGSAFEQKLKLTRAAKMRDAATLTGNLAGAKILLVEDNEVNQLVAKKILKKAGLEVSVANNGQQALEMFQAGRYDLILMDIQMPVMDGLAAARAIRTLEQGADIPIVALTAHSRPEDLEASFAAGMNDHLTKPIDVDILFHCLNKWLKTAPMPGG